MSHGVFLTCTQSVTKVTLSIAMTINTPTTCPPLAFVNLWLNQSGTEGRQQSHLTCCDKNKLMNKSCGLPHNSSALLKGWLVYVFFVFDIMNLTFLLVTLKRLQIILSFEYKSLGWFVRSIKFPSCLSVSSLIFNITSLLFFRLREPISYFKYFFARHLKKEDKTTALK